jgi:hypothetical protein
MSGNSQRKFKAITLPDEKTYEIVLNGHKMDLKLE